MNSYSFHTKRLAVNMLTVLISVGMGHNRLGFTESDGLL
jgi:hypothetical protein